MTSDNLFAATELSPARAETIKKTYMLLGLSVAGALCGGYVGAQSDTLVNLFTGKLVSGGWPLDWWADHRSPFPLMTAVQIETDLMPKVAETHAKQLGGDVEKMFTHFRDDIGWPLFVRAFKAAKEDGMNWEKIDKNPSALRTNYVCAYLQIGAEQDLEKYIKGVLKDYSAQTVTDILKAREAWKALPESDPQRAKLRDAFLHGDYKGK
ncbi:MAG: hypothetical protein ABSE73_19685 [Planctomycetota bacterium]